jgi:hypothetical protein
VNKRKKKLKYKGIFRNRMKSFEVFKSSVMLHKEDESKRERKDTSGAIERKAFSM